MKDYKQNVLSLTANVIPYHKEFRKIAGSVTASILWQQLEYWFSKTEGEKFYKFLSGLKEEKFGYKNGDSWTEELGFSAKEFRNAFKHIGVSYKSKKEFDGSTNKFITKDNNGGEKEFMYCSYYDKENFKTWYFRNDKLINKNIELLSNKNNDIPDEQREYTTLPKGTCHITKGNPVTYTENTTKNTTDIMQAELADNKNSSSNKGEDTNQVNKLIDKFKPINPSCYKLFANKSQRNATERMIKQHGYEELSKLLDALPDILSKKYSPVITTPIVLENKLGDLMMFIKKNGGRKEVPKA